MSVHKARVCREIFSMDEITMGPLYVLYFTEPSETYIVLDSSLAVESSLIGWWPNLIPRPTVLKEGPMIKHLSNPILQVSR